MTPIRYSGKVKDLRKYLKELEDKHVNQNAK